MQQVEYDVNRKQRELKPYTDLVELFSGTMLEQKLRYMHANPVSKRPQPAPADNGARPMVRRNTRAPALLSTFAAMRVVYRCRRISSSGSCLAKVRRGDNRRHAYIRIGMNRDKQYKPDTPSSRPQGPKAAILQRFKCSNFGAFTKALIVGYVLSSPIRSSAQVFVGCDHDILEQPTNDMVLDASGQRLLLTIPNTDLVYGNSVGFFDPLSLTITAATFVGSDPDPIAITDDGLFAYVGIDGSGFVKQLDLTTQQVVSSVHMGYALGGHAQKAVSIACQPGSNAVFVVSRSDLLYGDFAGDVQVYEGGVPLSGEMSGVACADLHFKPGTPDRLIGTGQDVGDHVIRTFGVQEGEIDLLNFQYDLFAGLNGHLSVSGDLALTDDGTLLNIMNDVPVVLGRCDIMESGVTISSACFDPYQGTLCVAYRKPMAANTLRVIRFTMGTFEPVDAFEVALPSAITRLGRLLSWGDGARYAIGVNGSKLIIINGIYNPTAVAEQNDMDILPALVSTGSELRTQDGAYLQFELLDMHGRAIGRSDVSGRITVAALPAGMYMVRFYEHGLYRGSRKWLCTH